MKTMREYRCACGSIYYVAVSPYIIKRIKDLEWHSWSIKCECGLENRVKVSMEGDRLRFDQTSRKLKSKADFRDEIEVTATHYLNLVKEMLNE